MILFLLSIWAATASGSAIGTDDPYAKYSFAYPNRPAVSVSPSGTLRVGFRPGVGDEWHRFSISDSRGRKLGGFDFGRSVTGTWAPDSDRLFVNNYEGSNSTYCLVSRLRERSVRLLNLMNSLARQKRRPVAGAPRLDIPEDPDESHFYLTCGRWLDGDTIEVLINGHTDEEGGGRPFSYRFRYSLAQDNFRAF